ncbi:hypothetical protein FQN54_000415 [Arachnomyces sp. PD_36]|nr:hypothetical protein FQN54_000415 [Arachnomyces sp. PD_36]
MPRPTVSSRKNQHSNRHENGLVVPGKRVSKAKSNGQVNGNASSTTANSNKGTSNADASLTSLSSTEPVTPPVENNKVNASVEDVGMDCNGTHANGYGKGTFDMSYGRPAGSTSPNGDASAGDPEEQQVLRRNSEKGTSTKKSPSNSINPFLLASTILKSCPMYDTIAILIFLLQLPPIVLTLVQFLFASLTFMPPAGTTSASLTSNFDIFQGPAGTPSLGTMIAMDGVCLLVWGLFMWSWAQNFALDLAHVQVAITLGGGSSGKNGGVNALCVFIVLVLHLLRSRGVQDFVLSHLLSAKILTPDILSEYSHLIPTEFRRIGEQSSPSWVRSLLAVHILAQAGTAMARRSMAKNRSPPPSKTGKRTDTEASAGSQTQVDSSAFESGSISSAVGLDGQMVGPSVLKENRDRMNSAKKRRRQANQVRSRQPFWAALASTKVTVIREYEHSRATNRATRLQPISEDDLQGANLEDGLIWITEVDGSSIQFAASDFCSYPSDDPPVSGMYEDAPLPNDDMEPFFVCVNGAQWATATIYKVHEDLGEPGAVQWRGKISGLAPNCTYTCSFIRRDNQEEISTVSVKTPPAPDTEQGRGSSTRFTASSGSVSNGSDLAISSMSPSPRPSLRPSSPTSTMQNSIANADIKLNERRSRLKRSKADHKVHLAKVKKEYENLKNRLNSTGDENRQKQRSLQLERNIKQTEEATAAIEVQLENLQTIPPEELEEWTAQKAAFDQELEKLNIAKEELATARAASGRDISNVESELASTVQKRERLQARRSRLNEQHERITTANAEGVNERDRRLAEQANKEREQAAIEAQFNEQIPSISRSIQDYQMRTSQIWQQVTVMEQNYQQQQQQQQQQMQMLMNTGPLTPEGNLPGTNPQPQAPSSSGMTPGLVSRPSLGLSFPDFNPNDKPIASTSTHRLSSPINSVPASPAARHPQYATSQFTSSNPFFGLDQFSRRDRASSNRSGRNSLNADADQWDPSRVPTLPEDGSTATPEMGRRSLLGNSSAAVGTAGPVSGFMSSTSPFVRAGSNGSGRSGSGSGGSGSGSPSSARGKGTWN